MEYPWVIYNAKRTRTVLYANSCAPPGMLTPPKKNILPRGYLQCTTSFRALASELDSTKQYT